MEAKEIINKISLIEEEIYNYITSTEHWLFYWITNIEVQNFIKEYPEDYKYMAHLQVSSISTSPSFVIEFVDHPDDIVSIERYGVLSTFRDTVKARWMEWNGKVKELQIKNKEEELAYLKEKMVKVKQEIEGLKLT